MLLFELLVQHRTFNKSKDEYEWVKQKEKRHSWQGE